MAPRSHLAKLIISQDMEIKVDGQKREFLQSLSEVKKHHRWKWRSNHFENGPNLNISVPGKIPY